MIIILHGGVIIHTVHSMIIVMIIFMISQPTIIGVQFHPMEISIEDRDLDPEGDPDPDPDQEE